MVSFSYCDAVAAEYSSGRIISGWMLFKSAVSVSCIRVQLVKAGLLASGFTSIYEKTNTMTVIITISNSRKKTIRPRLKIVLIGSVRSAAWTVAMLSVSLIGICI